MALTLHYHPLSSYSWKALIALYETGVPFEGHVVNLGDPEALAAFARLWPTAKIPLLQDGELIVPETSIIIEHVDRHHPGAARLLPADPQEQLTARLWDRLFDCYVMDPMQRIIGQLLRPEAQRDPLAHDDAVRILGMAYGMIEERMGSGPWAAGRDFTIADCAAAPALFYASTVLSFPPDSRVLPDYFERLMARPSVRQAIAQARPVFHYYPLHAAIPPRFLVEEADAD